ASQRAEYDRVRTSEGIWIAPSEALAQFDRNEFRLVCATIYRLRELAAFGSVQDALGHCATWHVPTRVPVLTQEDGKVRVFLEEDAGNTWEVPEHMTKS